MREIQKIVIFLLVTLDVECPNSLSDLTVVFQLSSTVMYLLQITSEF